MNCLVRTLQNTAPSWDLSLDFWTRVRQFGHTDRIKSIYIYIYGNSNQVSHFHETLTQKHCLVPFVEVTGDHVQLHPFIRGASDQQPPRCRCPRNHAFKHLENNTESVAGQGSRAVTGRQLVTGPGGSGPGGSGPVVAGPGMSGPSWPGRLHAESRSVRTRPGPGRCLRQKQARALLKTETVLTLCQDQDQARALREAKTETSQKTGGQPLSARSMDPVSPGPCRPGCRDPGEARGQCAPGAGGGGFCTEARGASLRRRASLPALCAQWFSGLPKPWSAKADYLNHCLGYSGFHLVAQWSSGQPKP